MRLIIFLVAIFEQVLVTAVALLVSVPALLFLITMKYYRRIRLWKVKEVK